MSQSKVLAFHVEGDTRAELRENIKAALVAAEINVAGSASADEAPAKPAKKVKADEAPAKPAKKEKTKAPAVTLEQVQEALTALRDSSAGTKAVKNIFAKFGVKKTSDIEEDRLADALKAAQAAMPDDDEEEEEEDEDDEDEDADGDEDDEDDEDDE